MFQQSEIQTPHFAVPFRFGGRNGAAVLNEQNDIDEIIDRVKVVLGFPIGSRLDLPEFGTEDLLFRQISNEAVAKRIASAVQRWIGDEGSFVLNDLTDLTLDEFIQHYQIPVKASS